MSLPLLDESTVRILHRLADRLAARRYDACHARAIAQRDTRRRTPTAA